MQDNGQDSPEPEPPSHALRGFRQRGIAPALALSIEDEQGTDAGLAGQARRSAFVLSPTTQAFRRVFYPQVTLRQWNDWRWQLRNRITGLAELSRLVHLTDDEKEAIGRHGGAVPLQLTPYYASLLVHHDPRAELRRTVVPVCAEYAASPGEANDPLHEEAQSPVPGLVHRYPDRVLFLVTSRCSSYCRYCTRSRLVGDAADYKYSVARWQMALDYIESTPTVRDVLLSGGDPLTLSDEKLDWLLSRLRAIRHVEFVRIGTKVPAALPQRVTPSLVRMLRRHHPLFMSLHFIHPGELSPETAQACERLADAGIPLGSQTVLLKGVNDEVPTMTRLMQGLLKVRVRPYYIYQCDPIAGSSHLRTTVEKGLAILGGMIGHTTGYAVPTYVIDAPGGGGKIRLLPNAIVGRDGDDVLLRNFEGRVFRYPDPGGTVVASVPSPSTEPTDYV